MPSDCCIGPRPNTGVQGSAKFYWLITFTKHGVLPVYYRNLQRIIKKKNSPNMELYIILLNIGIPKNH